MNDINYYNKAISRYLSVTHDKCDRKTNEFYENVIVFLEKEIDSHREKIEKQKALLNTMCGVQTARAITEQLAGWKKETEQRVKIIDEFSESIADAVQELSNKHDALTGRVEQLGQIVENKMDQVLSDTVQTLTEFTTEQISDGGCVTIKNANCYQDFIGILLANGYFVCSHIDDEPNEQDDETITIEFWRA